MLKDWCPNRNFQFLFTKSKYMYHIIFFMNTASAAIKTKFCITKWSIPNQIHRYIWIYNNWSNFKSVLYHKETYRSSTKIYILEKQYQHTILHSSDMRWRKSLYTAIQSPCIPVTPNSIDFSSRNEIDFLHHTFVPQVIPLPMYINFSNQQVHFFLYSVRKKSEKETWVWLKISQNWKR